MGVLAFYLKERGFVPPVTGLDVDGKKISRGASIASRHYPGVSLQTGTAASLPEFLGNVSMLDVLHYFSEADQSSVLKEMASRVAPGGWCIIRTTPRDAGWRFRSTLLLERFAKALTWMTKPALEFPTLAGIEACFPESEFTRETCPLWGHTPFNSWLLAFQRKDTSPA
jgi:hypothetical protein